MAFAQVGFGVPCSAWITVLRPLTTEHWWLNYRISRRPAFSLFTTLACIALISGCSSEQNLRPVPGATSTGVASYYSDALHGNRTASGKLYNKRGLTAAHPSLPFGTRLRVTNVSNGKHVDVIVTDRGPFAGDRIIDLSRRAAERIDLIERGTAEVKLEVLEAPEK